MNVLDPIANDPLVQIFAAAEKLMTLGGPLEHEGYFQSTTPRLVFEAALLPPFTGTIDPLETWGVVQRLVQSKDGKIWKIVDGKVERVSADAVEHEAACLVAEARRLGFERDTWATYVCPDGSFFPPVRKRLPGVLLPAPGPVRLVKLDDYAEGLGNFFTSLNEAYEERDLSKFSSATFENLRAEIVRSDRGEGDDSPDRLCDRCGRTLTKPKEVSAEWGKLDPQYILECVPCEITSYLGPIPDSEDAADGGAYATLLDELNAKILEEFPVVEDFGEGDGD